MTLLDRLIAYVGLAAMAVALAGLIVRGRARFCRLFTAYLSSVLVAEALVTFWPAAFWTWSFWLFKQALFDALKVLAALEIAYWIFLGFPGAAERARAVVFVVLVGTLLAVLALPSEIGDDQGGYFLGLLRSRLELGTAWVFTALAGLVRYYRIPLHPMHRTLIWSFVSYLLVFSTVVKLAADYGLSQGLATVQPLAYVAVCCWWVWEAWQREPAMDVNPAVVSRLQPWKA